MSFKNKTQFQVWDISTAVGQGDPGGSLDNTGACHSSGFLSELVDKTLLQKTAHILDTWHRESKLELSWKFSFDAKRL